MKLKHLVLSTLLIRVIDAMLGAEKMPRLMQPMTGAIRQALPEIKERMDAAAAQLKAEGIDFATAR